MSNTQTVQVYDFMKFRMVAAVLSVLLLLASIGSLAYQGLELGLDFSGGTLIELGYGDAVELEPIRNLLETNGYEDALVQHFGNSSDVLVRLPPPDNVRDIATLGDDVLKVLSDNSSVSVAKRRIENVGPQVGEELWNQSGIAMILALFLMLIYVSLRFKFKFAVGAVAALFHDAVIVVGLFSIFKVQFDLTVVASVLAVIGYSLNDTIVVSDRIRENFRKLRKGTSAEIINESLTQTLSRTVVTSLTTLLVLVALYVFGGEALKGFSIALIIGVVIGTYSSIYVASNVLLAMNISKEDFIEPVEDLEDAMP